MRRFNPKLRILLFSAVSLMAPVELLAHGSNSCWNTESDFLNAESEFPVFYDANQDVINQKKEELAHYKAECVDWNVLKDQEKTWKQQEFARKPSGEKGFTPIPEVNGNTTPGFPTPQTSVAAQTSMKSLQSASNTSSTSLLSPTSSKSTTLTAASYQALAADQYGPITIDGDLSDWTFAERLNLPLDLPPYLAKGDELYGLYVDTPTPTYLFALKSTTTAIGPDTTLWLNTDQNATTGYLVLGAYGGAEYFMNVYSDATPHLYDSGSNRMGGPLVHAYSADRKVLEIAIPASALPPLTPPQSIDILGEITDNSNINNTRLLFPQDYATGGQYTLAGSPEILPPRIDRTKRVGIVFSEATKAQFYNDKAYSQLFMSLQHQAMMAGIPFDLLTENELTDIANLVNYDALIFPYFAYVPTALRDAIHETLYKAIYYYGIGIVTADNWMTNDETGGGVPEDPYRYMKQLLGITRVDGEGPVEVTVNAGDVSHPAMRTYTANEPIIDYAQGWYSYFKNVPEQPITILVNQTVTGTRPGTYPAVLASETGGRHVHFATLELLGDTNLAWQALQWVLYDNHLPVGLKLGRHKSLFLSRNDTDMSKEYEDVPLVHIPLLELIRSWKTNYNFVGSYYINIGNDPANGQWTDWNISAPLFKDYIALDNEIGTHSWTHPYNADVLTAAEIEFEFNQSMNEISANLGPTWRGQNIRGGAVPGAPESLATAQEILQHLDYLTGGYSSIGAGYPSAHGYLTPTADKVYFSPNMYFDFSLIEFGVPVWDPITQTWQPVPLTAEEAEVFWRDQYNDLLTHASQPLVLWPWHDYAVTIDADRVDGPGYTVAMFENTIAMAAQDDAEFVTLADAAARITTFQNANVTVEHASESVVNITVNTPNVGTFALRLNTEPSTVIQSVDNWYAYHGNQVFLDEDGGTFVVRLGGSADPVTHITALPMRARLISLSGNGSQLNFTIEGKGQVQVAVSGDPSTFIIDGGDSVTLLGGNMVGINFDNLGMHTVNISSNVIPPTAVDDPISTRQETPVTIAAAELLANDTDPDGDTLSITSVATTSTQSGTIVQNGDNTYTYTPPAGFSGNDSFTYTVSNSKGGSAAANVLITVIPGVAPVAIDQLVDTNADTLVAITLTGSDADNDPLSFLVVTQPTQGTLDGTPPNLTYTPNAGFNGADSFTFKVNDGTADSNTATVNITVMTIASGDTLGLYNPLTSAFYLKRSHTGGKADMVYGYGSAGAGWLPVMGDWNNDGADTAGLYDPLTATFYLKNTHSGGKADNRFRYGPANAGWTPVVGDWNGDGTDTVGLYDSAAGTFYLNDAHSGGTATYRFRFGPLDPALIPLAGDWDGDGQDTVGLYHPRTGVFYLVNAHRGGKADLSFRYGPVNAGWQPLTGDWNGNGVDTIGLYRPDNSQFYLRQTNTSGVADLSVRYGPTGQSWQPLVGKW